MNRKTILKIGGFLLLTLVFFSCTDTALPPVFYAIEQEKSLVDDRGFPDDAVVQRIVTDGASYFAAAGALYTRTLTGNWSPIDPPVPGALCTNVEIFGTQLLAAYMSVGNTGLGLWQRNVNLGDYWSRIGDPNLDGDVQVGLLKTVSGNLFVSTLAAGTYSLYFSNLLPGFTPTNLTAQPISGGPISDIAGVGANYWVTVGSTLWSGTAPLFSDFAAVSGEPTTSRSFGGLYYSSSTNTLYLAADGKFYAKVGAGAWAASSSVAVDGKSVQFTGFVELTGLGGDIYAGTKGYGYYVTGTLTRSPSYTISALYNGAILTMLFNGSTSLFLGTYGSGLWRGDYVGGPEPWAWKQE
jgi:hypothetical protein